MNYYFSKTPIISIALAIVGLISTIVILFGSVSTKPNLPAKWKFQAGSGVTGDVYFYHRMQSELDTLNVLSKFEWQQESTSSFDQIYFHTNPSFMVWIVMISIMMGVGLGLIPWFIDRLFFQMKDLGIKYRRVIVVIVCILSVVLAACISFAPNSYHFTLMDWVEKFNVLIDNHLILYVIITMLTIPGIIGLFGMIIISRAITKLKSFGLEASEFRQKFLSLKQTLKFYLMSISFMISLTVVTTSLLRNAILHEVVAVGIEMVPIEFVYLYGLQFTIILAFFYLPIFYKLRSIGSNYIHQGHLSGGTEPNPIAEFMKESVFDNFKVAIAILSPLLGSIVPELLSF